MTRCKLNKKGYPLSVHRSPIVSEERFRRVAPKFLVPELGALFLVSKSGKVRVEERERDRGESSRLLVSAANVSTLLFLDGLIGERILVLGRLTEDRSSSVQRLLHSRSRSVSYRDDSPSRHPEVLLLRIWAWVSAKDGSMIWDESRRTVLERPAGSPLLSVQRPFR